MAHIFCTDKNHQRDLAELRLIHSIELAAKDAEIARLTRALQQATAHRVVPFGGDERGGVEYERSNIEWV